MGESVRLVKGGYGSLWVSSEQFWLLDSLAQALDVVVLWQAVISPVLVG